jgi:flavin-dependent dehydrogenase
MATHRAVIVGAGPGGAAAAISLAQRGITDVLLVDKDTFPRDKTCGSALSPNGVALIQEFGIGEDVRRLGYFDNLLVERAKALGVEFRGGFKASELVREGGPRGRVIGVRGKEGSTPVEVRADYVVCADGAHSIFSLDPRPKRTIQTLMGWWENFPIEPGLMEMAFDRNLAPLYGWMFPETDTRVNIGICIDGEVADPRNPLRLIKQPKNVRDVFAKFLDDHYRDRLRGATQVGKFKGHPISYTTWVRDTHQPGMVYLGEGVRLTHNVTGEGIWQAMQSGVYCAEALCEIFRGASEAEAFGRYTNRLRKRFTPSFVVGHVLRAVLRTPLLDGIAMAYNTPSVRRAAGAAISWALAGEGVTNSNRTEAPRNGVQHHSAPAREAAI